MAPSGGGRSTRQWMLWAFKLTGCRKCKRRYPELPLGDFHCNHLDPAEKKQLRGRGMIRASGLLEHNSHADLIEELAGCEVLCVDCHKEHHGTVPAGQQSFKLPTHVFEPIRSAEQMSLNGDGS